MWIWQISLGVPIQFVKMVPSKHVQFWEKILTKNTEKRPETPRYPPILHGGLIQLLLNYYIIFLLESHFANSSPVRVQNIDHANLTASSRMIVHLPLNYFLTKLLRDVMGLPTLILSEPTLARFYSIHVFMWLLITKLQKKITLKYAVADLKSIY